MSIPRIAALTALTLLASCGQGPSLQRLNFGRTAIITGDFDTVEQLIQDLAAETEVQAELQFFDGYIDGPHFESEVDTARVDLPNTVEDLLRAPTNEGLDQFKTVFFSDGMRGVNERVYNGVSEDDHLVVDQTVVSNIQSSINNGLKVYFSDWTYDLLEAAFPDLVDWLGDDTQIDAAQRGNPGFYSATIVDAGLAEYMGVAVGSQIGIEFDFNAWAVPQIVSDDVQVLITADIEYDDPETGNAATLPDVPLVWSATVGNGTVVFTAFHNDAQITDEARDVLRYELSRLSQ